MTTSPLKAPPAATASGAGAYDASLSAMIDKFLKGKDTTTTGNFATDLGSKPTATQYYTWDTAELPGKL